MADKTTSDLISSIGGAAAIGAEAINNLPRLPLPVGTIIADARAALKKWSGVPNPGWTGAISLLGGFLPYGKLNYESSDGRHKEEVKGINSVKTDLKEIYKDKGGLIERIDKWQKNHSKELDSHKFYVDGKTGKITKINPNNKKANKEFSKHNKIPVDVRLAGVGTSAGMLSFK